MKKFLLMVLCLLMALSVFVGCAKNDDTAADDAAADDAAANDAADDAADDAAQDAEPVTVKVSMGTNNPYGFLNEEEKPDGFVVDVWNEIGVRTGYTVEMVYMDSMEAHYAAIDAGKVDVLGIQVAITEDIKDQYQFTDFYGYNEIRMVCLAEKPYEALADLAGQKICIAPGKLMTFFTGYNEANPDLTIELVTTEGNIYEELDLGRFEAFPMTILSFEKMVREGKADPYKMFGEAVITEENVFPVSKDMPAETLTAINDAINGMIEDGTMEEISMKWYERNITEPFGA